jgi:hypothetical protein
VEFELPGVRPFTNQYHLYDNLGQEIELQTSEWEKDMGFW